jgi:hypothetical protein
MTNQLPPVPPYSTTPAVPNFGTRLARASWLAPLVALLLVVITFRLSYDPVILHGVEVGLVTLIGGGVLWIAGLVSGVVAIATMPRYGPDRALRPAIIGLCMTVAMLMLAYFIAAAFMSGPV